MVSKKPGHAIKRISLFFVPIIAIISLLLVAGCTSPFDQTNVTNTTSPDLQQSPSSYQVTIAQPEGKSRFIRMDTDVYNIGEVVEFDISSVCGETLECLNDPPTFSVKFQTGSGAWATKMGKDSPVETNKSYINAGKSSPVYRFVTTGWEPNRYRIVSDCGVSREFLLRPSPTPVPTICPQIAKEPVWIHINPIIDQDADKPFSISGTTNKAVGDELKYLVFRSGMLPKNLTMGNEKPLSTWVSEGTCGENTWSVDLTIQNPQEYYFMISAGSLNATAIRRFTVL